MPNYPVSFAGNLLADAPLSTTARGNIVETHGTVNVSGASDSIQWMPTSSEPLPLAILPSSVARRHQS